MAWRVFCAFLMCVMGGVACASDDGVSIEEKQRELSYQLLLYRIPAGQTINNDSDDENGLDAKTTKNTRLNASETISSRGFSLASAKDSCGSRTDTNVTDESSGDEEDTLKRPRTQTHSDSKTLQSLKIAAETKTTKFFYDLLHKVKEKNGKFIENKDYIELTQLLLNDINDRLLVSHCYPDGNYPIHIASKLGNISLVKKLLEYEAHTNVRDKKGRLPIELIGQLQKRFLPKYRLKRNDYKIIHQMIKNHIALLESQKTVM